MGTRDPDNYDKGIKAENDDRIISSRASDCAIALIISILDLKSSAKKLRHHNYSLLASAWRNDLYCLHYQDNV